MNTITLKRNLSFKEYQKAVMALTNLGIEIQEPEIKLSEKELATIEQGKSVIYASKELTQALQKSIESAENGKVYTQKEMSEKIEQRWK